MSTIRFVIWFSIQCPKIISVTNTDTIFGTKVSVCSWNEVAVWKILMIRPITSETKRTGADVHMTI